MQILSHRGHWRSPQEKNTTEALGRSFSSGFGLETDVRDALGTLVISHDPPDSSDSALTLDDLLSLYIASGARDQRLPLALNIKADGLATQLARSLSNHDVVDAFVFDMSVPDMRSYIRLGCPVFTRQSDIELQPVLYDECTGVWLDAFIDESCMSADIVKGHLEAGKQTCLVSSELHGRDPRPLWEKLRLDYDAFIGSDDLLLCTDLPDLAAKTFAGGLR